ncbi:LolA family protein [Azoarcus taiwanensis]|uniref:Outer membrane lipoprotein carrier protein LolA n=1 Tax=Azoarcus taiwanensis TaxID=666964 RepID=A0A972FEI9_9RHOO|nr:outer membrane lipoprotein carrier protein LolA [Azoarcus taiwanensis]NMG03842.1 hypothetical protein [Azoarcus taiwanensis]
MTPYRIVIAISLCACALLAGAAQAQVATPADPLSDLSTRLESTHTIHVGFRQTKHLAALRQPLQSEGRIVFVRGEGVLWIVSKPYQASYALAGDAVTETGPDGRRRMREAHEAPALANIGRVFESIFSGKLDQLDTYFDVRVHGTPANWQLDLTPREAISPFLESIRASGGTFVERININESRGDLTEIEFSAPTLDAPLSDEDTHLLRQR